MGEGYVSRMGSGLFRGGKMLRPPSLISHMPLALPPPTSEALNMRLMSGGADPEAACVSQGAQDGTWMRIQI